MPSTPLGPWPTPSIDFDNLTGVLAHRSIAGLKAANFVLWTFRSPWMIKSGRSFVRTRHIPRGDKKRRTGVEGTTAEDLTLLKKLIGADELKAIVDRRRTR